ncbi:hypothetical protein OEA41_007204 [Lepraria neglecta]|nr:hypothetical protein OEA41_004226 [Lepraria neglecta]KAK3175308.1 hypothetical protein OEA41_002555 [Lepraria neglecta]KAK3175882.1 hypothetical protein OEA41_007204 [Lepraria neglecta]
MTTRRRGLPTLPSTAPPSATPKPPAARKKPAPKPAPRRPSKAPKPKKPPLAKLQKAPLSKSATAVAAAGQRYWDAQIEQDNEEDAIAAAQEEARRLEHQSFYEKYYHTLNMDSQNTSGELSSLELSPGGKERYQKACTEEESRRAAVARTAIWDEFKAVGYSVEWWVHFEKIELFRDSTTHTMGAAGRLDWEAWYNRLHPMGREHADSEGKSCYTVAIRADLKVGNTAGKSTSTINMKDGELDSIWQKKVLSLMQLRHESRPKKNAILTFKVGVEFFFARTHNGILPASMLPSIPPTQSQIKAQQSQAKTLRVDLLKTQQQALVDQHELALIAAHKCTSPSCPNSAGGQCLLQDGKHYALDGPHIRAWVQCINTNTATPSTPPPNFHINARLRRQIPHGTKDRKKQEEVLPPITPAPAATDVMDEKYMDRAFKLATLKLMGKLIGDDIPASPTPHLTPTPAPAPAPAPTPARTPSPPLLPRPCYTASSSRSRALSHLPDADVLRPSSPVTTEDWAGYISWLCNIENTWTGAKKEAFEHAGHVLEEAYISIQSIQQEMKGLGHKAYWDSMDIKPGVGHHLARLASKYQAYEKQKSASRQSGTTKASPFDITSSPPPSAQVQVPASQATTQDKTGKPLSPQYYAPKNYGADDDYKSGSSDDDDMLETQRPLSENAIIQSIETQQWEREKAGYESYRRQ